ncbi:Phage holin T7 family, holin superfamily II [Aeromonas sp. RU39B]|nr:Phage holin T7 family, holin superfamily II [Aeromonas sp. RU39B]
MAAAAVAGGVAKSGPPVVVSGMTLAGYSLNDWVLVATLCWIVIQAGWFVWSNIIKPKQP